MPSFKRGPHEHDEYLSWSSDRETFVATLTALINPARGTPLAALADDGVTLLPSDGCRIDEIGRW